MPAVSPLYDFRRSVGLPDPLQPPPPEPSAWDTVNENVSNWMIGLVSPIVQGMTGGAVGDIARRGGAASAAPAAAQAAAIASPGNVDTSGIDETGQKAGMVAVAPLAGAMYAYDAGLHGINTAVAGTQLAGSGLIDTALGVNRKNAINPLYRDGFQLSDIGETYKKVWDGEVTFGQAQALTFGKTALNAANIITQGEAQKRVDEFVLQNTEEALRDPSNTRGLYSWASGLYSEFDIFDEQQKDSAFNQGIGRWITGTSDAALQWYAGPDVLAMKVAGKAGRSLFMQSINDFSDISKMTDNLAAHAKWREQQLTGVPIEGARKTAIGRLAESLVRMDELKISKHAIAKNSTDAALVGRVLGKAKTYDEVVDGMLAMSGDLQAAARIMDRDAVAADLLLQQRDDLRKATDVFNYWNDLSAGNNWWGMRAADNADAFASAQADVANSATKLVDPNLDEVERLQKVLDQTLSENEALQAAFSAIDRVAGVPNTAMLRTMRLSKLKYGPNSVRWMDKAAEKNVLHSTGEYLYKKPVYDGETWTSEAFTAAKGIGRSVRLWRAGLDYMKTNRIRGYMRLSDPEDVVAELEASMETLPMMRRLAKQGLETKLPGFDITVGEFRRMILDKAVKATTATERLGVVKEYDAMMTRALQEHYNLDEEIAKSVLGRYEEKKREVIAQLAERGWVKDGEEIHLIPELQSTLAEKMPTIDFRFIEDVFRHEYGSNAAQKFLGGRGIKGWPGIKTIDAIWRPLVLLRLGYTMRNVTEGNLRDLAAFGTLSPFSARSLSRSVMSPEDTAFFKWGSGLGNKIDTVKSLRYGSLKKIRNNVDASTRTISLARKERDKAQEMYDAAMKRREERRAYLDNRIRTHRMNEDKARAENQASVQWETIDDAARARATAFWDTVDEVRIPADMVMPAFGASGRRSNVVIGLNSEADVTEYGQQKLLNTPGFEPDPIVSDDSWISILPPYAQEKAFAIAAKNERRLSGEDRQTWDRLIGVASWLMTSRAQRQGDLLVRTVQPGVYQVVRDAAEITQADLDNAIIGLVPKDSIPEITHVRANVVGGTIDARINPVALPTDSPAPEDIVTFAQQVFGDEWAKNRIGQHGAERDLLALVELAKSDPEIADAIAFNRWINTTLDGATKTDFVAWATEHGLIIQPKTIKRLSKQIDKLDERIQQMQVDVQAARKELEQRVMDEQYLANMHVDEDGFSYIDAPDFVGVHGGYRVPGDEFGDTANFLTETNMENWKGPGTYVSHMPIIGGDYFVTKAIDDKLAGKAPVDAEPVLYVVNIDGGAEALKDRFIYLDEQVASQEHADELVELADNVHQTVFGEELNREDFQYAIDYVIGLRHGDPMDPLTDQRPELVNDYMDAIREVVMKRLANESPDGNELAHAQTFWNAWIENVRQTGALGIRHDGGRNQIPLLNGQLVNHDVFVFYDRLPVTRLDEISDQGLAYINMRNALSNASAQWKNKVIQKEMSPKLVAKFSHYKNLNAKDIQILRSYLRDSGRGRILVHDGSMPSGSRSIINPDAISVGQDSIDAALPSSDLAKSMQQQLGGADPVGRLMPDFFAEEAARQPRVFNPDEATWVDFYHQLNSNKKLVDAVKAGDVTGLSPQERAEIVRWMMVNDYTHLTPSKARYKASMETPGEAVPASSVGYLSAADILKNKKVGSAYAAMYPTDEIAAELKAAMDSDGIIATIDEELRDLSSTLSAKTDYFDEQVLRGQQLSQQLKNRLGKRRAAGLPVKDKLGSGTELLPTKGGNMLEVPGPFNVEAQGSYMRQLSSAQSRITADLYGQADFAMRNMRRSSTPQKFVPGDPHYWNVYAEQMNHFYRNDPIAKAILEGMTDEQIINELMTTTRGRSWVSQSPEYKMFKGLVDDPRLREDITKAMIDDIGNLREKLNKLVPDSGMQSHIGQHEVTPDFLRANLGWRSDLPNIEGYGYQKSPDGWFRKITSDAMHVLGTLPEDALVRHPFYRSRWREEMIRQANIYEQQGITDFTPEMINAMSRVANKWALKQTNETLYTIQRLSTPANAMRFIIPFFPAWASSIRFWMMKMPLEKPESIARYALAFDSPESAGWVYDDQGNQVQGSDNMLGKISSKLVGSENSNIVVQISPQYMDKIGFLTDGQGRINVSKGSLDMMLQGNYPFIPSLGPLVTLPVSWILSQKPDWAAKLATGKVTGTGIDQFLTETELTKAAYQSVVPFGTLPGEKDPWQLILDQYAPAWGQKVYTAFRGENDAAFLSTAQEAYRTMMTDWELGGKQGPKPEFLEAVNNTRQFYLFRAAMNLGLPFAPTFQSKYQFYIDAWRKMQRDAYANGGSTLDAEKQFINLYGDTFFRYTKSLSGSSSGMSATVGEYNEVMADPELMSYGGNLQGGTDSSIITIATRPYAQALDDGGFDQSVWAWQMGQKLPGSTNKFFRGGNAGEQLENDVERERGWDAYNGMMEQLNAQLTLAGFDSFQSAGAEAYDNARKSLIAQIGGQYPRWAEEFNTNGGDAKWMQAMWMIDGMMNIGSWWDRHGNDSYGKAIGAFVDVREQFVSMLEARASNGGSASIQAKSNADLALAYASVMNQVYALDETGAFADMHRRWFRNDPLKPVPMLPEVSSRIGVNSGNQ